MKHRVFHYLTALALLAFGLPAFADATTATATATTATTGGAFSVSTLSAEDMINNLATQLPQLMRFTTALAYVMGMYMIFFGILKLKQYGEARTQMSGSHELKGPLIFIFVGAMLLYLPTSVQVGLSSFWTEPNPYGYTENTDEWSGFINNAYMIIQLVGTIAFIRGLLLLSRLGGHGGSPDTLGKAMTHIIGGIFCINIYQFIQLIMFTLGIQVS